MAGLAAGEGIDARRSDTHRGGNTDPLVVHWPGGITDPGALRTQYHHIVDVYPTLLELAGLPVPEVVNGIVATKQGALSILVAMLDVEDDEALKEAH